MLQCVYFDCTAHQHENYRHNQRNHKQTEAEQTEDVVTIQNLEKSPRAEAVEAFGNVSATLVFQLDFAEIHIKPFLSQSSAVLSAPPRTAEERC